MAITLDPTIGGSSSNTYTSLAEAEAYIDERLNTQSWDSAPIDAKSQALITAARRLDRENWMGDRVSETQRLAWPRIGVNKPDPSGGSRWYMQGNSNYVYGQFYRTDEVPEIVKQAQCELALAYLDGFKESADQIESYSMDGISVKKKLARSNIGLPPEVLRLIGGLITGARLVRA